MRRRHRYNYDHRDTYHYVAVPPEHWSFGKRKTVVEHLLIAERALGHRLPKGAVVHHFDGNKRNNARTNLVICEDQSYHRLLHRRQDIILFGGNPETERLCHGCMSIRPLSEIPCQICAADYKEQAQAEADGDIDRRAPEHGIPPSLRRIVTDQELREYLTVSDDHTEINETMFWYRVQSRRAHIDKCEAWFMAESACLVPGCGDDGERIRGVCRAHYAIALMLINRGKTTWERLEAAGKVKPSQKAADRDHSEAWEWFQSDASPEAGEVAS